MSFTAMHPDQGRLDATLPDLGCGWDWTMIHRAQPPAPLACPECGHGMNAKKSQLGLRFFAHRPGSPACALSEESMAHHLLKLELAQAARAAGWTADLEVTGPDGSWRADVLASTATGRRMALEAQLAGITVDEIRARTARMSASGVRSCWFSDRSRIHWLGAVPSVRLDRDQDQLMAVEPMAQFATTSWHPAPSMPLAEFVRRILTSRLVARATRKPQRYREGPIEIMWASPGCFLAEAQKLREEEQERLAAQEEELRAEARQWTRDLAREAELIARIDHTRGALARHSARLPGLERAMVEVADMYRTRVTVGWSVGDARYCSGIPLVNESGTLLAVFDPLPQSLPCQDFLLDVSLPLLFPTDERRERFEQFRSRCEQLRAGRYRSP